MALDPIWQRQLTLVTYGNQYLAQELNFSHWINHCIFSQHMFAFRDLVTQQLLAQHFQIWLEGLKAQGVTRLSLHCSSLLLDEKNPNPNIELIPYAHFIVSHSPKAKHAWICGRELAAWYKLEEEYQAPLGQEINVRLETLWRYELNAKLAKRVAADLVVPNWDEIEEFLHTELFSTVFAQDFDHTGLDLPYYGTDNSEDHCRQLALIPTDVAADYAHFALHRFDALVQHIAKLRKHSLEGEAQSLAAEQQVQYRHFAEKTEDLQGKFIVKVANHYPTARLTRSHTATTPLDTEMRTEYRDFSEKSASKVGFGHVMKLIVVTAILCALAYYFGF